jgi:hypothetical protein
MKMDKPKDIPEDVWAAAEKSVHAAYVASIDIYEVGGSSAPVQRIISRAILAERDRCAKIARRHGMASGGGIAHMIESGYEPEDSPTGRVSVNPTNSAGTGVDARQVRSVPIMEDGNG